MKRIAAIFSALLLSACSSFPDALQVADDEQLVSYSAALEQPQAAVGKTARWGGVIADVRNSDSGTVIEVVNFDLQRWGRPLTSDQSQGRFRAKISGFVDPMVWKQGSSVTFVGTVAEPETGAIDEYTYLFPVITVSSKYLWPVRKEPARLEVNYDALWYRHYWYSQPTYPRRIYYPGPVMDNSPKPTKDN